MTSYREIFSSSTIIGGAKIISIFTGIVKVKVLAVLLGPEGIGLMGMYQNTLSLVSTIAGCGLQDSGVRQLAASAREVAVLAVVRRVLWQMNLILGLTGMAILWLLREPVAELVFGNVIYAKEIGWLGLGVLLTLIAGSQTALLQGLRRIGDLAKVNIIGSFFGAVVGISVVYYLGESGVVWFVITAPAVSALVAMIYAARLPRLETPCDLQAIWQQCEAMLKLGVPLMVASLMTIGAQLIARSLIMRGLGLEASGYFQAAWLISASYMGILMGAMGTDYFPRLTEVISDRQRATRLVNEQTEMGLLLFGPALLIMIALAPWILNLLYAESFTPASEILRWQVMGDIFRMIGWPMGFIAVAQGRGGIFIATQFNWNAFYLVFLWYGLDEMGLLAAGIGFFIACVVQVGVVRFVAGRLIGFTAMRRNIWHFSLLLLMSALIMLLTSASTVLTYAVGLMVTLMVSIYSIRRLDSLMDLRGWIETKLSKKCC